MNNIKNRTDFVAFVVVNGANPNGNVEDGCPRVVDKKGVITDVCVKHKIRNRMKDMGEDVFVISDDRADDGFKSLQDRAKHKISGKTDKEIFKSACEKFIDVRAFGTVMAYKGSNVESVGERGCVSIKITKSINNVKVVNFDITKCVNGSDAGDKKGSDTIGSKSIVQYGLYKVCGSINARIAEKNGFSEEDMEILKEAIRSMFCNDESSARPAGSMFVDSLYWFTHETMDGRCNSNTVFQSVSAKEKDGVITAEDISDFEFTVDEKVLSENGVSLQVIKGW